MTDRKKRSTCLVIAGGIVFLGILVIAILTARFFGWRPTFFQTRQPIQTTPYLETFDVAGTWITGEGAQAMGEVTNGVYEMTLGGDTIDQKYWASGGRNFADAVYQVEATPLDGTPDNGYGMLFRVDRDRESFYIFKVSSDGYVLIALCTEGCSVQQSLVGTDWFDSRAVLPGFDTTNILRVEADGPEMTFYVNDVEVGRAIDDTLKNGDIGLYGETFAPGGLKIAFDNFNVSPYLDN